VSKPPPPPPPTATGTWIGASYALGRPAPVDEPYPHVCGHTVYGRVTPGIRVPLRRRDCAACVEKQNEGSKERGNTTN